MAQQPFKGAKAAFQKAKAKTTAREQERRCGFPVVTEDGGLVACQARGSYTEEFRGEHYHIVGKCSEGHRIERYGYSDGGDGAVVRAGEAA